MKKLSFEKMEKIEGGDGCDALMWWAFHEKNDDQAGTFELMFRAGCHLN